MAKRYDNSPWPIRLVAAHKQFGEWHSRFKCDTLEDYYEGFQWRVKANLANYGYNPYTLNLYYSTIKIKLANFLFQRPKYIITPKPGNSDWAPDLAISSALTKQDTLNTIIGNPNCNFVKHTKLAALDSFFRFGLIEVGYAADWQNPQKAMPHLKSWDDTQIENDKDRVIEDIPLPANEHFYVKRIKPKNFRVSASESTDLGEHEWCGYYQYYYTDALKKTPGINWSQDIPDSTSFSRNYSNEQLASSDDRTPELVAMMSTGSLTKVWHIFDQVANKRCLYVDGYWDEPIFEQPIERLPFLDLRWDLRTKGWYPIPPSFQWISPQDEINEAREQTRSYRRRFTRKFEVLQGMCDEEEQEKFISGPDGSLITVKQTGAIKPIDNPEQGHTAENALLLAKDDFILISGSSAEVRKSDRETATKSTIEDQRAKIRESAEQLDFSNFVCLIGRELLATAQEKMAVGMWVKYSNDPGQGMLQDIPVNPQEQVKYQYITSQDITDGYDYEIELDVINGTPAAMQEQENAFVKFLTIVQKFPMIMLSPILIRKAAYICGFRDEQVIQQMQQAALLQMAAQAEATEAGLGNSGQPGGQTGPSTQSKQMESPVPSQIEEQINNQVLQ